jgi:hypothetical protein
MRWIFPLAVAVLFAAVAAPADDQQQFHLTYTTQPLDEDGTIDRGEAPTRHWYKGHRSRIDNFAMQGSRPELTQSFIMDCDSSRMITIDWSQRTYTIMTFEEFQQMQRQMMQMASRFAGQMPGVAPAQQPTGAGGTVTVTTAWRDSMLDERRFGLPVRWVSSVQTRESSPDACYADSSSEESHRWITDLDLPLCIPPFDVTGMEAMRVPKAEGCTDRIIENTTGTPRHGFVLREWTVREHGGDRSVYGWEVTELSRDSLPDSLFVPPTGFREVEMEMPTDADMDAAAAAMAGAQGAPAAIPPKTPGTIRIGVSIKLPPGAPVVPAQVAADVARWIQTQGPDAVPLRATAKAAALAEAPTVEADYVLFYDLEKAEMKVSAGGMLGGALGGALGARAAGGAMQLEVEGAYELLLPDGERVTDGDVEEKEAAEDPQAQFPEMLEPSAGEAIRAISR